MRYDPFQAKAINYINEGHSVIVSAPTGAGKTVIAEHVIHDCLKRSKRAVYTAPIKALSNQKFRDFQVDFRDKIGILTGDVSINPHAPILIMTTEIFRNKVLGKTSELEEYSWIIFDEIHYLDDYERGTVWEESLIFLPKHMKMLALSATIPNIDEFAAWIRSVHKKSLKVVKELTRPVPLHFFYQYQGSIIDNVNKIKDFPRFKRHSKGAARYMRENSLTLRPNRLTSLVNHLITNDRLPCVYFSFSRRRCEYLAEELCNVNFVTDKEQRQIIALYSDLCKKFDLDGEKSAEEIRPFIEKGIAYHHAGMLPTLKEVVERLFTSRLIKIIFTTETFALGINMPARTVIFDELRKYYGRGFATLKTRDFYQMAGRAGRRGIDEEGFVYSRVNPRQISRAELKQIIFREPETVRSRFNAAYATILNLYNIHEENLYDIYPRSFHSFQAKHMSQQKAIARMRAKVDLLKELDYISSEKLTEKGNFASQIYGYELSLSELYTQGILETLSVVDLAVLCVALVFEPRKGSSIPKLNMHVRRLRHTTDIIISSIHRSELKRGINDLTKNCYYHLSPALEGWMGQLSFNEILRLTDVDEGEIIRTFRMGIQVLREILDTPASSTLKAKIKQALYLINRDIIDAEKQLRKI
ncbi:MAG: DEAD/DEAH box helicase [Candidatus Omnitrophota bacterium]